MYLPKHFEESRPAVLHELIRAQPLGLLVTLADAGLQANTIPFILDPDPAGGPGILRAHVARANPLWRETRGEVESLVVFQGEQAYISPGWYPSKAEHGKVVPTWNYVMVQARGTLRAIDDAPWLRAFVTRLTERHEAPLVKPWAVTDAPPDFIDTMLRAIVGIEIQLSALTGKWKVSQNRSAADRAGVAQGLRDAGVRFEACSGADPIPLPPT
ncbi:MAG TPA: FMN-binding negative transcriptional regulator [Burkholderiaceae bacterium]|jgi:transcriptional regulator